jgi:cation transport ATPase
LKLKSKKTLEISKVLIGNQGILVKNNIEVPAYRQRSNAATELFLAVDQTVMLVMRLNTHSNLRPEAVDVIRKIMIEGQEVHILSGDSKESVLNLG